MCSDRPAITVSGISKSYLLFEKPSHRLWQMVFRGKVRFFNEHEVLRNISFEVARGQTVGLVGRNGAGKSTLLSILCGTLTPTSGHVDVQGKVAALLELGAGFNPELTGRENIDLCAQIYGLSADEVELRRESIIEFADIGDYIDRPVKTYSSGMFTRLGFSVVAHVDADILIVDEALAVGDAYFVQKCMRYLHRFRDNGGTLVFVSHDMGSVTALCDRVIWLKDGVIAMDDTPKAVAGAYLADLYRAAQGSVDSCHDDISVAEDLADVHDDDDGMDPRVELLKDSNLRNDIEIFKFSQGHDFGTAGVVFEHAAFVDTAGRRLAWVVGGERVKIALRLRALRSARALIIGFVVKDRQGQPLFGDNTFLRYMHEPLAAGSGDRIDASFEFRMPILPVGDYAVSLAVADGTQKDHDMHQWIHDALIISSRSSSVSTGLIGIPMHGIEATVIRGEPL
ncbi:ABC transporter ATP-binding protein [Rhodanobacter ginsengiterrae]|uniref:ABC transporter ATP-binding protein n=1 Tax=Rhodanobacter ginsengiterrae TaxID=2008451 RepID=UPI003CEFF8F6